MGTYSLLVGETNELITDSQKTREIITKLVADAAGWAQFLPTVTGSLRGTVESLREWAIGTKPTGDPGNAVIIYRNAGQTGPSRGLNAADEIRSLSNIHHIGGHNMIGGPIWVPWNDRIQAINVREGYYCALYEHDNFGGDRLIITGFARVADLEPMGFCDRASSLLIYPIKDISKAW